MEVASHLLGRANRNLKFGWQKGKIEYSFDVKVQVLRHPFPIAKTLRAVEGVSCALSNVQSDMAVAINVAHDLIIIPYVDGLQQNGVALPRMVPKRIGETQGEVCNTSDRPILVCVIEPSENTSIWMHGSRTRSDFNPMSDLDLICVSDTDQEFETKSGPVSLHFNCREKLQQRARSGDLFAFHLVQGAVAIHDVVGDLDALKSDFKRAESYDGILHQSADFADFLMSDMILSAVPQSAIEKLLWCVRSTLMAEGHYIFGDDHDAAADDVMCLNALREAKYSKPESPAEMLAVLTAFFERRQIQSLLPKRASFAALITFFETTGNRPASRFIKTNLRSLALHAQKKGVSDQNTPFDLIDKPY